MTIRAIRHNTSTTISASRRRALALLLAGAALIATPAAWACSCHEPRADALYERHDTILIAKATRTWKAGLFWFMGARQITELEVLDTIKSTAGPVPTRVQSVPAHVCGMQLREGDVYLLYPSGDQRDFIHSCNSLPITAEVPRFRGLAEALKAIRDERQAAAQSVESPASAASAPSTPSAVSASSTPSASSAPSAPAR